METIISIVPHILPAMTSANKKGKIKIKCFLLVSQNLKNALKIKKLIKK